MDVDQHNATTDIQCVTNAEPGDIEGLVTNLHPSFPIPKDQLHQDGVFPWLKHVQEIGEAQASEFGGIPSVTTLEDLQKLAQRVQPTLDAWNVVKKAWSLDRNGRQDLATKELSRYRTRGYSGPYELPSVLFHFSTVMLNPALLHLFSDIAEVTQTARASAPIEFDRFRDFFVSSWRSDHLARYFEIFKEYFSSFHELSQTLLHCQYGLSLPDAATVSSTAFADTRMLYGNLYETLTTNCVILGCLNNMRHMRPFDRFETIGLKRYLTIHKAKRADHFRDNDAYSSLMAFLDSTLRNASHHGAIQFERQSAMITFRSGGIGALQRITYAEYLYRCNQMFLRLCALLMLELALAAQ